MDTQSAASPCCASSLVRDVRRRGLLLASVLIIPGALLAQLNTGVLEGILRAADGSRMTNAAIIIIGGAGFRAVIRSNSNGALSAILPYGRYELSGENQHGIAASCADIFVAPLQTVRVDLVLTSLGASRCVQSDTNAAGVWSDVTRGRMYPEPFSLHGLLLSREPSSVTQPLDFTGLSDNRLAVESQRGFSWTETQYKLHGIDATDSYQPGFPLIVPDIQALSEVVVRSGFGQTASSSRGTETGIFLSQPEASWHGSLFTANTGAGLSSTNLPAPGARGLVQQADQFRWFTRDGIDIGGPLTRRADFYASGAGQWVSQSEPLASPGTDRRSRLLFGNARARIRAGARNHFDGVYSGSRIDLFDSGIPAGLEALTGNRMAASFVLPGGFAGEPETDHLDFLQAGWTHLLPESSGLGAVEVRYGYSVAHLNTRTDPAGQSRIELLRGMTTGAPPLANLAVRPRHEIEAAWTPPVLQANGIRYQIAAGAGWKTSEARNRFTTPSDMNLITASGAPAFVTEFNTPLDSCEVVRSFSTYVADHITLAPALTVDMGALADFSRGSLPAQSSPPGTFASTRTFASQPDLVVWNSVSPRAGFAWRVPHSHGLIFRGAYFRLHAPLAARYLDFGNPNSLGGSTYQWGSSSPGAPFQANNRGNLLVHFGGPYSSISPNLGRPYSDEFDIGAEFSFARHSFASIHLFRRDDKKRIAAIDTGVPAQAFTPITITDSGPDGIPGTFDDQLPTVYAQSPATLGQDRYLLTNPADLRMMYTGLLAETGTKWRGFTFHASLIAEKSYGPTNPGNAFYENDPGVIGALFLDPNTAIHAAGRIFGDRAFVGKIQANYRLPAGIELASVAAYTDGLVFARQLLVTNLPQGPLLVAATVRGSPEGGNRAQYAINWNLRIGRQFRFPLGRLRLIADILNVANSGQKLQEDDLSGPSFNLREPVSVQPPRFVRFDLRYEF